MSLLDTVTAVLGRHGEAVTLRSDTQAAGANAWTAGASTSVFYTGRGREDETASAEIKGGIEQQNRLFSLDPAGFPVLPKKGDRIALGTWTSDSTAEWLTVVDVDPQRVSGRVAILRVQARR